ncbi:MAG: conjugal transfer protein TraF [Thiobacillus sp.]|nr:conjugal transfer protein TraF [Thiobacillus sp.]
MRWSLVCLLSAVSAGAWAQESNDTALWWERSIWTDPDRTYQWYPPDSPPEQDIHSPPARPEPRDIRELKTVRAIREELERLKDVAVMTPTPENVHRFLDAQQFVMEKGAVFADVARRVVWASPELDYSLRRPTHNAAIQTWKVRNQADEVEAVAAAMRSHGLYFFLRGDCPYCHQLAPVLKYLESAYGMEVFPISLDGGGLPGYPTPRPDNGIARLLGVSTVPALYLMPRDATTGNVPIPLGQGMLSADEIVQRIYVLTRTRPGDSF